MVDQTSNKNSWETLLQEARKQASADSMMAEDHYWQTLTLLSENDCDDDQFVAVAVELCQYYLQKRRLRSASSVACGLADVFRSCAYDRDSSERTFAPIIRLCVDLNLFEEADMLLEHALLEVERAFDANERDELEKASLRLEQARDEMGERMSATKCGINFHRLTHEAKKFVQNFALKNGMKSKRVFGSKVAVGIRVTPDPPHRSVRAHFSAHGSYFRF